MQVLHVHSGNLFGGVERILETLAATSVTAGMETSAALCFCGRLSARLEALGARVHDLGPVRASRPWQVTRAQRRLRRLLEASSPDVVVAHSDWSQALFGPVVRSGAPPLVRWLHAPEPGPAWQARLAERAAPDLLVCNSNYTQRAAAARFAGVRREVVYAPMVLPPPGDRDAARGELDVSDSAVAVILIAARLEPWKGHRELIAALARLRVRCRWEAWVAAGPQRAEERRYLDGLRRLTEREGLADRVRFLGERTDLARVMAAADIYCQPNTAPEPYGMSIVEALATGLPVVASNIGALPEIVDAGCGLLIPPAQPVELAAALSDLLDDPDRRARLASGARARAGELADLPRRLNHLRAVLRTAIERPRLAEAMR